MNTNKTFAEKIASEYAHKETRKVVALKKIDNRAKRSANIFAYTFGVVAALLLGDPAGGIRLILVRAVPLNIFEIRMIVPSVKRLRKNGLPRVWTNALLFAIITAVGRRDMMNYVVDL